MRRGRIFLKSGCLALSLMLVSLALSAQQVDLIGVAEIGGDQLDRSGLKADLGDGLTNNMLGGISAMEYTGRDDLYIAVPDRGPLDGAVQWQCRFNLMEIKIPKTGKGPIAFKTVKTTILSDEEQRPFTGSAAQYQPSSSSAGRLDPEAVRLGANGNIYLSDEYGPHLFEMRMDGSMVRRLPVPSRYLIKNPGLDKADENGKNNWGRSCNRGMECLALSPDKTLLYGLMQSPLLQDSLRDENCKPYGLNCRLIEFDIATGSNREFLYQLDNKSNKLNEILALNDHEFLVIERDGTEGAAAVCKQIKRISLQGASEIQCLSRLPGCRLPRNVRPVKKATFIDLLDPKFGLVGESMPEKIESLTFGPDLADGRKTLLVVSDNDFVKEKPTMIYVFAISSGQMVASAK